MFHRGPKIECRTNGERKEAVAPRRTRFQAYGSANENDSNPQMQSGIRNFMQVPEGLELRSNYGKSVVDFKLYLALWEIKSRDLQFEIRVMTD